MKWTLSNYSHKSKFLSYYRECLPRLNSEFCFKRVFSDFTASLDASWHVSYNQSIWELTGWLGADFMLRHSYLTTVSWRMVNGGFLDKLVVNMQKR